MEKVNNIDTSLNTDKQPENVDFKYSVQTTSRKSILPKIIGFLLIIAGILAILNWMNVFSLDIDTLGTYYDITQLQQIYPNITSEQFLGFIQTCASIGIIISFFPILGGILAIKRKMWGISIACSIIGIFSIGIFFTSSLFSFIAIVILLISKKEFQ